MKLLNRLKLNQRGFGHIELVLVIAVVVVIGGVGSYVWAKHNTSHAGSYTQLSPGLHVSMYACEIKNPNGNGYQIKANYTKDPSTPNIKYFLEVQAAKTRTVTQKLSGNTYWGNTTASLKTNGYINQNSAVYIGVEKTEIIDYTLGTGLTSSSPNKPSSGPKPIYGEKTYGGASIGPNAPGNEYDYGYTLGGGVSPKLSDC